MNTIRLGFPHTCGKDAQIMNVYFRSDNFIVIEGVCIVCSEGFNRTYPIDEMRKQLQPIVLSFNDKDKTWLNKLHIKIDEEAA